MYVHIIYTLISVLMIMASHQTFSGQLKHLTGQTKFGQSNILYIINGKVIKFLIEKSMSGQFSILIISTVICTYFNTYLQLLCIIMIIVIGHAQYILNLAVKSVKQGSYVCVMIL